MHSPALSSQRLNTSWVALYVETISSTVMPGSIALIKELFSDLSVTFSLFFLLLIVRICHNPSQGFGDL